MPCKRRKRDVTAVFRFMRNLSNRSCKPRYLWRRPSLHPKSKAPDECISVVARTTTLGHFLEFLDIATAENDVLGLEGCAQPLNNVDDVFPPFVLAVLLQTAKADVVLVRSLAIRKMAKLHRLQESVDDHGGAEARAQAEEQHASTFVAAQRLHGGIINSLDRASERLLEVKPHP